MLFTNAHHAASFSMLGYALIADQATYSIASMIVAAISLLAVLFALHQKNVYCEASAAELQRAAFIVLRLAQKNKKGILACLFCIGYVAYLLRLHRYQH